MLCPCRSGARRGGEVGWAHEVRVRRAKGNILCSCGGGRRRGGSRTPARQMNEESPPPTLGGTRDSSPVAADGPATEHRVLAK